VGADRPRQYRDARREIKDRLAPKIEIPMVEGFAPRDYFFRPRLA
jgi:hypothetical protein